MDIGIKIIIAVVVILVLIGIKMVCDEKARKKRMREFLINSWGKSADRNYSGNSGMLLSAIIRC